MSNIWIFLVVIYGVCKGLREGVKKKSLEHSSKESVLFFYTFIGFLMSVPFAGNPFDMPPLYYFWVLIKSFIIFLAWIMSFSAIKKMPIGYYGILDMARVLFSTVISLFNALITPTVTLPARSEPSGLPIATASSPTSPLFTVLPFSSTILVSQR